MSYQVLARKWRPKTFQEMVGQEHVLQAMINALDHDRLHHAYLFTGTRGVGKTTIARILSKCLNCEVGVSSQPCGECGSCKEIDEGRFVDLMEIDAASNTRVEDTRDILENVQYAPTRGRYKVYLIDEVHMLSNHSFNALLKTLEEPPPHVKFLLATTDPQKLPVTILSRCLQFSLKNMAPQRIVEHLSYVLKEEAIEFETEALWELGRAADGSMRDAMSLTDQAIAFTGGQMLEAEKVRVMLGTIDRGMVQRLVVTLIDGDVEHVLQVVNELSDHAPDYMAVLADLISSLHRIALAQALPTAIDDSFGDAQLIAELASKISAEDVQLYYQIALQSRRDLPLSPDQRAGLEMALLRMLLFKPAGQPTDGGKGAGSKTARPLSAPRTPAGNASNSAAPVPSQTKSRLSEMRATLSGEKGSGVKRPGEIKAGEKKNAPAPSLPQNAAVGSEVIKKTAITNFKEEGSDSVLTSATYAERKSNDNSGVEGAKLDKTSTTESKIEQQSVTDALQQASEVMPGELEDRFGDANQTVAAYSSVTGDAQVSRTASEAIAQSMPKETVVDAPKQVSTAPIQVRQPAHSSNENVVALKPEHGFSGRRNQGINAAASHAKSTQAGSKTQPMLKFEDPYNCAWADQVRQLDLSGGALNLARNCALIDASNMQYRFYLSPLHQALYNEQQAEKIRAALQKYHGTDSNSDSNSDSVKIDIELQQPPHATPLQLTEERKQLRLQLAAEALLGDPFGIQMRELFGAELITDTVRALD